MMQHTSVWYRRSVSPFVLVASVAVFLTATANLTFFDKISQTYPILTSKGYSRRHKAGGEFGRA